MIASARVDSDHSDPSRPLKTFLHSGFTAISNEILDNLILKLPWAEARLLIVICRFSTGFLRDWCYIGEQKLLELTDMSRSALYAAKSGLLGRGIIEINHSKQGRCVYRLHSRYQVLKTGSEKETVHSSGPPPVQPTGPMKESKDNLKLYNDHHHHENSNDDEFLLKSFSNWNGAKFGATISDMEPVQAFIPVETVAQTIVEEPTTNVAPSPTPQPKPTSSLTRKLLDTGVNAFMARRLVQTHPEELIQAALDRVQAGSIKNPAAYLVSELSRGGYAAPANPFKVVAEKHEQVHQRRQAEKQKEEQSREKSNQAAVTSQLDLFEKLPPLERDVIVRILQGQAEKEQFNRLPGWGPEHPVWKGLLAEIVRTRGADKQAMATAGSG